MTSGGFDTEDSSNVPRKWWYTVDLERRILVRAPVSQLDPALTPEIIGLCRCDGLGVRSLFGDRLLQH